MWCIILINLYVLMIEAMGCALCSSAAVCRAAEWAVWLPVCFGFILQSSRLKAVFKNEEEDSRPRYRRRSSFNAGKAFFSLNLSQSTHLHPKFSDQTGHWICFANCQLCAPASVLQCPWSCFSRSCTQPLWSDGAWRLSTQQLGLCLSSLAWEGGEGATLGYSQFPNSLCSWEGLRPALSIACEWNPCLCIACDHLVPGTRFALGTSALPSCFSAQVPLSFTASSSFQPFWSDRHGRYSQSGWLFDLVLCLGIGRPGSRAGKTHLRIQMRSMPPLIFLVRMHPWLDSADKQNCRLGFLLGHCRYELSLPRSLCWCCKHVSVRQIPSSSIPQISQQPLYCEIQISLPAKWPTMLGGRQFLVCPGSLFPLDRVEVLPKPVQVVLCWTGGGARQSAHWCIFYLSHVVFLGLHGAGMVLQPHLQVLGFSPWYLVLEQLLVFLPVRGPDVRKNLSCHLDDVTLSLNNFNFRFLGGMYFQESGGVLFNWETSLEFGCSLGKWGKPGMTPAK